MKLNLLPTYVSKGKQAAVAWIAFALIVVVSVLATLGMMRESTKMVENQKERVKEREPYVTKAVRLSEIAGEVLNNAQGVILNSMLAESMLKHNAAYPDFYDGVKPYIPSFYRITSMTAAPLDADNATLTLTGVVQTQGQYRDLMLALNKIPEVRAVARTGYDIVEQYVPRLVEIDQTGRPIARTDSNIPDDPLARLDYLMAKGGISGFSGAGGFGTGEPGMKGAMPNWSVVTVTVVLPGKLQTPNPRATLSGSAAAASAAAAGGPAAGGPGGIPGGAGGPRASGPVGPGGGAPGPASQPGTAPGGGAPAPANRPGLAPQGG